MRKTQMKKLTSVLLVLAMLFTMVSPVMAANDYSITVSNTNATVTIDGNTYEAYKLFHATYSAESGAISYSYDDTCLEVTYAPNGTELSGDDLIAWLGEVDSSNKLVRTDAELRAFADHVYETKIKGKGLTPAGTATANGETATIDVPTAGYYLVFGTGNAYDNPEKTSITASVSLTSAKPTATVKPKFDAPTLEKEIYHNDTNSWGIVGDNQIGDTVYFRVETLVPNVYGYDSYVYTIHDTMSEGLTSNVTGDESIEIKVDDAGNALSTEYYDVTAQGNEFTVSIKIMKLFADKKVQAGDSLFVYYNAVLNSAARIYPEGPQENKAYLEYSSNPYTDETGDTAEDIVYDWTFKMDVNKVDSSGNALNGAVFVLSNMGNLDMKNMQIRADGTPDNTTSLIGLVKEADNTYRIATNEEKQAGTGIVYTINAGSATIKGLDDVMTYYLYETKAPDGYNQIEDPVSFKIHTKYNADGSLDSRHPAVIVDGGDESVEMGVDVVNNSGTTLPETGGMGTTVFYVLGGALVLGAVVLLVTRKRMGVE